MKATIHPNWYPEAQVTCACGNIFTVGSTAPEIHIEVCSKCHPFFTGEAKFVDAEGRVDRFLKRAARKQEEQLSKKEKRLLKRQQKMQEERERPKSLKELRSKAKINKR